MPNISNVKTLKGKPKLKEFSFVEVILPFQEEIHVLPANSFRGKRNQIVSFFPQ